MSARNSSLRQRGASLVSVMVGLVVGLLVALTAMGSLTFFTASQKQSGGINSTLGAGMNATAAFKYELAQAGRGFMVDGAPVCERYNISVETRTIAANQTLLPVEVSRNTQGSLVLDVRYASALESATPVVTRSDTGAAQNRVELNNFMPVSVGQAVMLAPAASAPGSTCTVLSVTDVVPADGAVGQQLVFGPTGRHNQAQPVPLYPAGSRVFLLGTLMHTRFTQAGQDLVMSRPLDGTQATLAQGVRLFDLELGVTDGVSDTLSSWTRPIQGGAQGLDWSTLNAARLGQIKALRVGFLLQSPQPEKPDAQGSCQATSQAPELFGQDMPMQGNDACFRYREFTAVVAMRNLTPVRGAL